MRYTRHYENNTKSYYRLLLESVCGASFFTRYTPEQWIATYQVVQEKTFKMRYAQEKFKAVRRNWRYWPGYWLPAWFEPFQKRNYFYRLQGPMRQLVSLPKNWRKELDKVEEEPPGAAQRDLLASFEAKNVRVQSDVLVREINLPKRPFESNGNFAICYSGRLLITEDGEYEFGTNSNSLTLLRLDGKELMIQSGKRNPSEMKIESVKVKLPRGAHEFELYYNKIRMTTTISAFFRKAGEGEFRLMSDEDFHPAMPAKIIACVSHDGTRYPVLRRNDRFLLHTAKRETISLQSFTPVAPAELEFNWDLKGETVSGQPFRQLALHTDKDDELTLQPLDPAYAPVKVNCYKASYDPVSIDSGLSLHLWFPLFIYDDEKLDCFREVNYRMPLSVNARLRTIPGRNQAVFPARTEAITLAAKPTEATDRFAQDVNDKKAGKLDGAVLAPGLDVEFELSLPGQVFDRQKVRFLPVPQLPDDLAATPQGLADSFGNRIVPVLKRPSLHDLRAWELPKTVGQAFQNTGKLLIIGEEFGEGDARFSRALAKLAEKRGFELEFLPWAAEDRRSGSRMLDSLPGLLPKLSMNAPHSAVIIPPSRGRNPALAGWENERIMALILEKLRLSGTLRELFIATPLPSVDESDSSRDDEFATALRRLKREYGATMIELGTEFKAAPDYRQSYREGESLNVYPIHGAERAAELLLKNIR